MKYFEQHGHTSSLYNINHVYPLDWSRVKGDVTRTKRMLIIDDGKSLNPLSTQLVMEVRGMREVEVVESISQIV